MCCMCVYSSTLLCLRFHPSREDHATMVIEFRYFGAHVRPLNSLLSRQSDWAFPGCGSNKQPPSSLSYLHARFPVEQALTRECRVSTTVRRLSWLKRVRDDHPRKLTEIRISPDRRIVPVIGKSQGIVLALSFPSMVILWWDLYKRAVELIGTR